jgi:hypothetical protein
VGRRKGTDPAKAEAIAERDRRALEMRRAGAQYEEIAIASKEWPLGFYSRSHVYNRIKQAMERARSEMFAEADLYRAEQLSRYETLLKAAWEPATHGDEKMMREARLLVGAIAELTGANMPIKFELGEGDIDRLLTGLDAALNGRPDPIEGEVVVGEIEG